MNRWRARMDDLRNECDANRRQRHANTNTLPMSMYNYTTICAFDRMSPLHWIVYVAASQSPLLTDENLNEMKWWQTIEMWSKVNVECDSPICNGSFTDRFLYNWSPRWNSSAELLAKHEYRRMSSSLSGKLQNAIRNCNCSGTGGKTCSTNSNGMNDATHFAASSVNVVTWWSASKQEQKKLKKLIAF